MSINIPTSTDTDTLQKIICAKTLVKSMIVPVKSMIVPVKSVIVPVKSVSVPVKSVSVPVRLYQLNL